MPHVENGTFFEFNGNIFTCCMQDCPLHAQTKYVPDINNGADFIWYEAIEPELIFMDCFYIYQYSLLILFPQLCIDYS